MGCLEDTQSGETKSFCHSCCTENNIEDGKVKKKPSLPRARTNADDFDFENYKINMLRLHNEIREKHSSHELKENEELNDIATHYAESLVNKNVKTIINKYNNKIVGINIIISESNKPEDILNQVLNEENNYDYNENKFSKDKGHFTQIIWKNTTDIGFGFWEDKDNQKYYNVILYYPAGNILGEFKQNVKEKK